MSATTLPPNAEAGSADDVGEVQSDEGLRCALRAIEASDTWERQPGPDLVAEIRRRVVRNVTRVASATDTAVNRGLVDDVLLAAWMILREHGMKVVRAERPWAYLMSSAQAQVIDETRAQHLLTNTGAIRGRAREMLPHGVRPVGSTSTDLATAPRHEPCGSGLDVTGDALIVSQIGHHQTPPLAYEPSANRPTPTGRAPWFRAFVDLLVRFGADRAVTMAAIDRMADLFTSTSVDWQWEWAARRDPVLAGLGLSPEQSSALVALLAGSRQHRHNGKQDSLLAAIRATTENGDQVEPSAAQRRRLITYAGRCRSTSTVSAEPARLMLSHADTYAAPQREPAVVMKGADQ